MLISANCSKFYLQMSLSTSFLKTGMKMMTMLKKIIRHWSHKEIRTIAVYVAGCGDAQRTVSKANKLRYKKVKCAFSIMNKCFFVFGLLKITHLKNAPNV